VRKTICDVLGTFNTPALHWKIPDKDRKLKSVLDNEAVERRTGQDDFLPTSNKLYQRGFRFKGGRDTANAKTTNQLEENCLKTFYMFLYYVKHGNRVHTTDFAEKATL
jgi:hypothetical protein